MNNEPGTRKKWWQQLWFKIILILLAIGLVSLLASMQMAGQACHFEQKEIRYYRFFPINMIYFFCWGLLFFPIQWLCNFISKRLSKWFIMVLLHVGLGVLFSFAHLFMFNKLLHAGESLGLVTLLEPNNLRTLIYRWLNSNIYLYIAIVGFLHFFYFYRQHREKELQALQLETRMAQVQLQSLKSQLHPHFLFNALNTISAYVKKSPETAIKMTARLSDLLRLTLETKTHLEIPLEEELAIVDNYLEIEKLRFADRMEVKRDIPRETRDALVPAVLLQPLVENAVRHGLSRKIEKGTISISAGQQNGKLVLVVEDDGPGETGTRDANSNGIGLKNIRERLRVLYGAEAVMEIDSRENRGFKVTITLPFRTAREAGPATKNPGA